MLLVTESQSLQVAEAQYWARMEFLRPTGVGLIYKASVAHGLARVTFLAARSSSV